MQHPHDLLGRHRSPSPHSARAQRERGPDPSSGAKSGFKGSEMFSVGKLSASIPPPCSYTSVDTQIHPQRWTHSEIHTHTHTHDTHRSHTAPQAGEHTVDTHTHTQKLTPRRHAQKLHCNPHTETHTHGDTLQCAWQPTHRIPILRNTHKESQSSGQCFTQVHTETQVPTRRCTGSSPRHTHGFTPQEHTATLAEPTNRYTRRRRDSSWAVLCTQGHRDTKVHRKTRRLEAHTTSARSQRCTRVQALTHAHRPVQKAHTAATAGAGQACPASRTQVVPGRAPQTQGGPPVTHTHPTHVHQPLNTRGV